MAGGFSSNFVRRSLTGAGLLTAATALPGAVAMAALGLHLYHGTAAMLMSLGASHPRFMPRWRKAAAVIALLVAVGFAVIPIAVYFHFIR